MTLSKYVVIQQIEDEDPALSIDGVHGPFDSYDDAEEYGNFKGWLFAIREIQESVKPKPKMDKEIIHERRWGNGGYIEEMIFNYGPGTGLYRISTNSCTHSGKLQKWSDSNGWCYLAYAKDTHDTYISCHDSIPKVVDDLLDLADKLHQISLTGQVVF